MNSLPYEAPGFQPVEMPLNAQLQTMLDTIESIKAIVVDAEDLQNILGQVVPDLHRYLASLSEEQIAEGCDGGSYSIYENPVFNENEVGINWEYNRDKASIKVTIHSQKIGEDTYFLRMQTWDMSEDFNIDLIQATNKNSENIDYSLRATKTKEVQLFKKRNLALTTINSREGRRYLDTLGKLFREIAPLISQS